MVKTIPYCLLFVLFLLSSKTVAAHGDLDERIANASKEIETNPDSALLYLERGELYHQHEEFEKAISDFQTCKKLNLNNSRLSLGLAQSHFKLEHYKDALVHLDEILGEDNINVLALRWKGHTLMQLNRFSEAAFSYEKTILYAEKSFTENYMEVSVAWEKHGTSEGIENAVKAIEGGIRDLGPLVVFYNRLVTIHEKNKNYEQAIVHQNTIIDLSNRKEFPFCKRAELWLAAGDSAAAKVDLIAAKNAIEGLSPSRRKNSALKSLLNKITSLEATLN